MALAAFAVVISIALFFLVDRHHKSISQRETEILRFVAKGLTAKQIAERLSLSHRTVENHVQATFRKLQVGNRVELARYAIEHGLDE